jgi:hypothetical protein
VFAIELPRSLLEFVKSKERVFIPEALNGDSEVEWEPLDYLDAFYAKIVSVSYSKVVDGLGAHRKGTSSKGVV